MSQHLYITIIFSTLLFLCSKSSYAEGFELPATIEVTVKSLNVREGPPWFSLKTVFTFKYSFPPVIAILKKGVQVTVIQKAYVGNDQRWLKIKYEDKGSVFEGWIYSGQKPNLVNIKKVDVPSGLGISDNKMSDKYTDSSPKSLPLSIFFNSAIAQQATDQQVEMTEKASTLETLGFQIISIIVFVLSFTIIHKQTNDKVLTIFGSSGVLLILGVISQTVFEALTTH
ncbi:MAG: hypothetical protein HRU20_29200 [Pseudomonadales bacterium]|nr:hypothetical protein [Pseudomonadales bacterium]